MRAPGPEGPGRADAPRPEGVSDARRRRYVQHRCSVAPNLAAFAGFGVAGSGRDEDDLAAVGHDAQRAACGAQRGWAVRAEIDGGGDSSGFGVDPLEAVVAADVI